MIALRIASGSRRCLPYILRHRSSGLAAVLVLLALVACERPFSADDEAVIRSVMADQEAAWDRGDIPAYMNGYTDDVCFTNTKGTTCGRASVTANYQLKYPDKAAMGDLSFGIHELFPAGKDHVWSSGTWQLVRTADTLAGGFTLLWERQAKDWLIVRDHSY